MGAAQLSYIIPFSGQLEYHCTDVFQRWHSLNFQNLVSFNSLVIPFPCSVEPGILESVKAQNRPADGLYASGRRFALLWWWAGSGSRSASRGMDVNPDPNKSEKSDLEPHQGEKTDPDTHQCESVTLILIPKGGVGECLPGIKLGVLGPVVDLFLPCKKYC